MRLRSVFNLSQNSVDCWRARRKLSAYLDSVLPHSERRAITVHLRECPRCTAQYEELSQTRSILRRAPMKTPPADLTVALRVLASQERSRQQQSKKPTAFDWLPFEAWTLRTRNWMQPLAIPFAGGIVSALVLFSMLVPAYPMLERSSSGDVPTTFYTDPTIKSVAPFELSKDEVMVELVIDEDGRVIDYSLPGGPANAALRREIENNLLFARFTPATAFGQPKQGKLLVSFRRSHIDVKG